MAKRICPVCNIEMQVKSSPDFNMDECSQCRGIFLDKSELNAIATSLAGDIEHMTADDIDNDDRYPNRKCPNCKDTTMRKMELLGCSGIVFDYCESCDGFFLDKNEIEEMNKELVILTKRKLNEEYRGEIKGYLVRKDRTNVSVIKGTGPIERLQLGFNVRVSVYFKRPLNVGTRITSEDIGFKFTKLIGIQHKEDIQTGNSELDGKVIIQADDGASLKSILNQDSIANAIVGYIKHKPKLFTFATKFEILDDCISCIGGPYAEKLNYNVDDDPEVVVEKLITVAEAIDNRN